jgi:hypothetical protein
MQTGDHQDLEKASASNASAESNFASYAEQGLLIVLAALALFVLVLSIVFTLMSTVGIVGVLIVLVLVILVLAGLMGYLATLNVTGEARCVSCTVEVAYGRGCKTGSISGRMMDQMQMVALPAGLNKVKPAPTYEPLDAQGNRGRERYGTGACCNVNQNANEHLAPVGCLDASRPVGLELRVRQPTACRGILAGKRTHLVCQTL